MSDPTESARPEPFSSRFAELGAAVLHALATVEEAQRRIEPGRLAGLRAPLEQERAALARAREAPALAEAPPGLSGLRDELARAARHAEEALAGLAAAGSPGEAVARVLAGLRAHARAQECLYPLRAVFPPLGRFFVEAPWHGRLAELDPEPPTGLSVGIHRAGGGEEGRARGGFSLYVPERTDGSRALPLVVALHGAFGHGADFLWTWLREARGRGFLLLAPSSRGTTWSLAAPERDGRAVREMVAYVCARWPVDRARILLTGLSDGASFALRIGLGPESPFTAVATVAGVLHPASFAACQIAGARGRRIYQVHGARDWLFPAELARAARDALSGAGADLVYREIEDLAHAWPREENDRILRWFDPGLALPD
jgi:phospholipase/carboxylesterase